MKNIYRIISLLIFTVTITLASSAQSKAEKQVASLVEELRKAMIDPEKTKFEKIVSDDLSYGHSGGKVEDKAAFMDAYLKGRSDYVSIDLTDQSIKIYGKTAIVRHKLSAVTNDNNKPGTLNLIILYVWHKEKSNWKLLARQAVKG